MCCTWILITAVFTFLGLSTINSYFGLSLNIIFFLIRSGITTNLLAPVTEGGFNSKVFQKFWERSEVRYPLLFWVSEASSPSERLV